MAETAADSGVTTPAFSKVGLVYDALSTGHCRRGVDVLSKLFRCAAGVGSDYSFRDLLREPGALILQTADYYPLRFVAAGLLRAIIGRRTLGILFRNYEALSKPLARLKRRLFVATIQMIPLVEHVRITPPANHVPNDDWIFDVEWWDLAVQPTAPVPSPLPSSAATTLLFVGSVSRQKGIDFFLDAARVARKRGENIRFAVVGTAKGEYAERLHAFAQTDGIWLNFFPSDDELVSAIAAADVVWCCYSPEYDQSSGVFGRALQTARPTVVREGSILAQYQRRYGAGRAVIYGDADGLIDAVKTVDARYAEPITASDFLQLTHARLQQRLGGRPPA